ncbi:MAG: penicillin-binding transpeptidase domain-containing protein [Phycisphaeraceae bacterium]
MIRRLLHRQFPSMFQRRLMLLMVFGGVVVVGLSFQAARLTVGESHRRSLAQVEDALVETTFIPTVRGRILDRWGRVLAVDEPGFDIAVNYQVISGDWAYQRGRAAAQRSAGDRWAEMSPERRRALVDREQAAYDRQAERLWQTLAELGGVPRDELERRKSQIVQRVHRMSSHLYAAWQRRREIELGEPVALPEVIQPIGEQRQAHSLLRDVDQAVRRAVQTFQAEASEDPALTVWQQVELRRPKQRRYPQETQQIEIDRSHLPSPLRDDEPIEVTVRGVGVHVVGLMRDFWAEDKQRRPFRYVDEHGRQRIDLGGYLAGDRLGRFGVEASTEDRLRGLRGQEVRQLDTGRTQRTEPVAGSDVELTLDIRLQARIQALMSPEIGLMTFQPWHVRENVEGEAARVGERLNGAAVVLDAETSEVLAAVSVPSMPLETLEQESEKIYDDRVNMPYLNRAVARPFQPGSTIKPLVFVSAVSARVHPLDGVIDCIGHLYPDDPNHYRCWIFKAHGGLTHGPLDGAEAIARSCNVYFYALGRDMGVGRIGQWFARFGLGEPTGVGLPEEVGGDLPDPATADARFNYRDAIYMGIGQGPVRWTPMQAAGAYATLVRRGRVLHPTIIRDAHRNEPRRPHEPRFHRQSFETAMQGLNDVVNASYGSGRTLRLDDGDREPIFNIEDVTVYGKSGTAEGVPLRIDSDEDGRITGADEIVKRGDHAWFIALATPPGAVRPTHVVAVVVAYGGSGSQTAGPIANQILHAMRAEGLL